VPLETEEHQGIDPLLNFRLIYPFIRSHRLNPPVKYRVNSWHVIPWCLVGLW
jgi:hypothetical protein